MVGELHDSTSFHVKAEVNSFLTGAWNFSVREVMVSETDNIHDETLKIGYDKWLTMDHRDRPPIRFVQHKIKNFMQLWYGMFCPCAETNCIVIGRSRLQIN